MEKQIKRLFIETDILRDEEVRRAQRRVSCILDENKLPYPKDVFDETCDFAWHEADRAWDAVKRHDEIYGDSSLVPLCGYGTYTGAPVVMDVMMKKALDEGITGKSLFFLRPFKDIEWDGINTKLLKKCFKRGVNSLYTLEFSEYTGYSFNQVIVSRFKAKK